MLINVHELLTFAFMYLQIAEKCEKAKCDRQNNQMTEILTDRPTDSLTQ